MKVLIVEDDRELASKIGHALRQDGMIVDLVHDGDEAAFVGATETYDAAVLDIGLPNQDGISVLRHWREQGQHMPVLMLTARGRWSDKLAGFDAGADDYLTKPFLQDEVGLRLRVLRRRALGHRTPLLKVGPLQYDTHSDRFTLDGSPLSLTAQEKRILAYLIQHPGDVITRNEINNHVYARDLDPDSNTVDVLIGRIRRKLGIELIHTERGRGFRLAAKNDVG
ncbi:MAG: response regulator transcription factor, partial [Azonexus sp.]|jgi:two-component system OmpR family response regulator|nr:response regulator transcription factor [Azonexus sp.]